MNVNADQDRTQLLTSKYYVQKSNFCYCLYVIERKEKTAALEDETKPDWLPTISSLQPAQFTYSYLKDP